MPDINNNFEDFDEQIEEFLNSRTEEILNNIDEKAKDINKFKIDGPDPVIRDNWGSKRKNMEPFEIEYKPVEKHVNLEGLKEFDEVIKADPELSQESFASPSFMQDFDNYLEEEYKGSMAQIGRSDAANEHISSLEDKIENINKETEMEKAARITAREQEVAGYILGESMHENWRNGRHQEDGTFAPRWKGVEDKALNDKTPEEVVAMGRDASEVVDIANTKFEDLPPKWQGENLAAGQFAAQYYTALKENPDLINNKEWVEKAAEEIHIAWSERNSWEELANVPYNELSETEKQKDRDHLTAVSNLVEKFSKGEINLADEEKRFGLDGKSKDLEL